MKSRLLITIPLLLVIGFSVYFFFSSTEDHSILRFSGTIEVTQTQMSFRIAGQLEERSVEEGDSVRAGQSLAKLENSDQRIALLQSQASRDHAKAALAELEAGSRQEDKDRAKAKVMQTHQTLIELQNGTRSEEIEVAVAEHQRALAAEQSAIIERDQEKNDYDRYSSLQKEGSVSNTVFEGFQTRYNTAENRVREAQSRTRAAVAQLSLLKSGPRIEQTRRAEAVLQQAEAEYALVLAGPRRESIDQARAGLRVADERVNHYRQQLKYTEMPAPSDGVVLSTSAEPGEYLQPASPVLTLGRLDKPWLRAYIPETMLGQVQLGQEVKVTNDSFPGKTYSGRISYISSEAEFTPKTVQTFEERVKLMFRIKVALDNPDNELKPGMPADGSITLSGQ